MTPEAHIIENMLMIVDKDGVDVPFKLNVHQRKVDERLTKKNIVPKPRQEGISSYVLALFTVRCLSKRNTRAVVISHDIASTQKLLGKVHYYLSTIRGPKPALDYNNRNEITFPKTNSTFYIGTQGTRDFGRGDMITDLLGSEVASWDNPKELTAGVFQAVPKNGTIILESTGKGAGTWYHRQTLAAREGRSSYTLHFPDWRDSPEYCYDVTPDEAIQIMMNLDPELEEDKVADEYNLTPGQILWRREKIIEMDYDLALFKQEYPLSVDECFQSTGYSLFHRVNYVKSEEWITDDLHPSFKFLRGHPNPNLHYVMGCDVGAGVEKDSSVIQVLCLEMQEQVGEYASNKIAPDEFAAVIGVIGERYNYPMVVVESNNHGVLTLDKLKSYYPLEQIYKDFDSGNITHSGFRTTKATKPMIIGNLRKSLAEGLIIHSDMLQSELNTFIEAGAGKLEASKGCHDDRVMALAMANLGVERQWRYTTHEANIKAPDKEPHYLSFEHIYNEMQSAQSGYPVKDQV